MIRENGAVPATIGIINGLARVGMSRSMIEALGSGLKSTMKVSRRDLPYITGLGLESGGTTVAGTMVLAHMAGIRIFSTGGIGGVHRAAANSMDISADLMELSRTNVAVVCSGPKPFLDIERTVEYLETMGVPVMTFGSLKAEKTWLPVFYSRDSLVPSPLVVETPADAAAVICMFPAFIATSLFAKKKQMTRRLEPYVGPPKRPTVLQPHPRRKRHLPSCHALHSNRGRQTRHQERNHW